MNVRGIGLEAQALQIEPSPDKIPPVVASSSLTPLAITLTFSKPVAEGGVQELITRPMPRPRTLETRLQL